MKRPPDGGLVAENGPTRAVEPTAKDPDANKPPTPAKFKDFDIAAGSGRNCDAP